MAQRNAADTVEGWVSVGLMLLPGIPLWMFWDELMTWSGGYGETIAGVTIFSQVALLLSVRAPLTRWLVRVSEKINEWRNRLTIPIDESNPAQGARLNKLRDMPTERLRELAAMGADLARMDAEQNLRVRVQRQQAQMFVDHALPVTSEKPDAVFGASHSWKVYVDENLHYMDEGERYVLGSFDCYEAAVFACRKIVDDFLMANSAGTADELFESYVAFGEDPWIAGPLRRSDEPMFSARDYARRRSYELSKPPTRTIKSRTRGNAWN